MVQAVGRIFFYVRMALGLFLFIPIHSAHSKDTMSAASIVFYYGDQPASQNLERFDMAVIDPDTNFQPDQDVGTRWFAYVSLGEASRFRDYYKDIPQSWIVGYNREWRSDVIDQTAEGWPDFVVENIIAPLWQRGYTGFFLDTLDSYQLIARDDRDRKDHRAGLVSVIRAIKQRFPEAKLIQNRGFELLPETHQQVDAVAFESLFQGWSEAKGQYVDVPENDRQWLLDRVREVRQTYGLPVIAIDYCSPSQRACSKQTIKKIRALGLIPYVGDGRLQQVNDDVLE